MSDYDISDCEDKSPVDEDVQLLHIYYKGRHVVSSWDLSLEIVKGKIRDLFGIPDGYIVLIHSGKNYEEDEGYKLQITGKRLEDDVKEVWASDIKVPTGSGDIMVQAPNGHKFPLEVGDFSTITVARLKTLLQYQYGLMRSRQQLFIQSGGGGENTQEPLKDSMTLEQYRISKGSALRLEMLAITAQRADWSGLFGKKKRPRVQQVQQESSVQPLSPKLVRLSFGERAVLTSWNNDQEKFLLNARQLFEIPKDTQIRVYVRLRGFGEEETEVDPLIWPLMEGEAIMIVIRGIMREESKEKLKGDELPSYVEETVLGSQFEASRDVKDHKAKNGAFNAEQESHGLTDAASDLKGAPPNLGDAAVDVAVSRDQPKPLLPESTPPVSSVSFSFFSFFIASSLSVIRRLRF